MDKITAKPIALGRTAEIYDWKDGWILKLGYDWVSRESMEGEANLTRQVHASGLPVPAVGDIVQIDGRWGLELEHIEGGSMLADIPTHPWRLERIFQQFAELHVQMHTRSIPGMPSLHQRLAWKIQHADPLSPALKQAALDALRRLPQGDRLCHGDFHPDNLMLTPQGLVIIDWIDASAGNPLADIARTSILIGGKSLPPGTRMAWLLQSLRERAHRIYMEHYFRLSPVDQKELASWMPVIAAARLNENIPHEQEYLLSLAKCLLS